MKFAFFGSPKFAKIILEGIVENGLVPSVLICNSDKPVGRKKQITPPLTKDFVFKNNLKEIKILQPETKKELEETKLNFGELDFGIVCAYSKIISDSVIKSFKKGIIGVHPSILPKYRGCSPIQSVLLDGEKETGVSLYLLDEKMDHGQILTQKKIEILESWNYEILEEKLALLSADMLTETIPKFFEGKIEQKEQDHSAATFTKKIETQDGFVDLEKDGAKIIERKIKALNPNPGVFTILDGKRTKLIEIKRDSEGIFISKIIPEGKKEREVRIYVG